MVARTLIFDSADPNSSSFVDEIAVSSGEENEDYFSFEDDLHPGSSSDESATSGRSRLSRVRSNAVEDDSSDDGRSQRLVRAFSRVVMPSSSNRYSSRRYSSDEEDKKDKRSKWKRKQKRQASGKSSYETARQSTPIEETGDSAVEIKPVPSDDTPPGVLLNSQTPEGDVAIALPDPPTPGEGPPTPGEGILKPEKPTTGLRFRNLLPKKLPFEKPTAPHMERTSTKKTRRRYSGSMGSAAAAQRRAGWEPGVDVRTTDIILQSIGSAVTIVDYSATRYRIVQTEVHPAPRTDENLPDPSLTVNAEFHYHLNNKPSWSQVRWISVNGLSWEAISAISKRFQLHRLAIEDMVDIPQRTKVDIYPTHTFCCLPLHKLIVHKPESKQEYGFWDWAFGRDKKIPPKKKTSKLAPTKSNASTSSKTSKSSKKRVDKDIKLQTMKPVSFPPPVILPAAGKGNNFPLASDRRPTAATRKTIDSDSSSSSSEDEDEDDYKPLSTLLAEQGMDTIHDWNNPYASIHQKSMYIENKRPLSVYKRAIGVEQVSLFLTSQDTVISFFEHSAADIERPLIQRLSTESTILRETCDPSLLLQAIVDAIVDLIQPIVAAYRRRIDELEVDAMVYPSMSHTQDLHLMAGELSMLRNTMVPITNLVLSLRDHASAVRSLDLHELHHSTNGGGGSHGGASNGHHSVGHHSSVNDHRNSFVSPTSAPTPKKDATPKPSSSPPPPDSIAGSRISELSKVYLADISDHLLSHTQDLDVMRNNTKNMIDLIFNTISIHSSDNINQLSFVTVVFLPLSFWTGYFGMNFKEFGALDNTVAYYWAVAIPFSLVVLFIAMAGSIVTAFRRAKIYYKKQIRSRERRAKKRARKAARRKMSV